MHTIYIKTYGKQLLDAQELFIKRKWEKKRLFGLQEKKKDHLFLNGRIKMKQMATVADKPTLTDS